MEKAEKVQVLSDLVSINTVGGNELGAAQYIKSVFDKYGIKMKFGRCKIIGQIQQPKLAVVNQF